MIQAYKLIKKATGEILAYSNDNTVIFGGEIGKLQNPVSVTGELQESLTEWQENTPLQEEFNADHNAPIIAQIEELEKKQARKLRELSLAVYESEHATRLTELSDFDAQIIALRATLL